MEKTSTEKNLCQFQQEEKHGRRDVSRLSLDEQNKLSETIWCVKGVLELMFTNADNSDGVNFLLMDAERKLDDVEAAIERLTAA